MKSTTHSDSDNQKSISLNLKRRIDRHFYVCSATLGASVALAAGGRSEVKGDIIYSGTVNAAVPFNNASGLYFDFDTLTLSGTRVAGVSDANLFDLTSAFQDPSSSSYTYHVVTFFGPNSATNAAISTDGANTDKLGAGFLVGAGAAFDRQNNFAFRIYSPSGGTFSTSGNWLSGGTGFIGFRFLNASNQTNFGWMRLNFNPSAFGSGQSSLTVLDYAYENSGQSIVTGAVPEPSSTALAFLAGGAAGLCAWRKRRRENLPVQPA